MDSARGKKNGGRLHTCVALMMKVYHELVHNRHRFMNHRPPPNCRYQPTEYEHAANCATHALWILPSIVGSAALHRLSDERLEQVTAWVYGLGLCGLFIVSTIYHIYAWKGRHFHSTEHCFHICDRVAIYLFTAASYTPWLFLRELGPWASHMRWVVWLMACSGALFVFMFHGRYKLIELVFYLTMGISPALAIVSMPNREGLSEVAIGGALYIFGVIFFKSDGRVPFAHAIWHLFVALAATIHYYAIFRYLYMPLRV
ncbi:monocyte to macrophage differentiation factor-like [Lethenteron reissneri]|uniref:monocyte to macrophage differentiation factor-like n=1 Tax=Lethenteron reissneri TaxID=7753 RepID=UPI002AB7994E|nr:monocyte to macrophage differentiation factor-like [Lethenteron reissneri]XP_061414086.1 monocyte to macrophage differentiation factor-like [Lethenteron reissneri]XP_061414093.1 monocyte to macrophage differentiation factor-like [Lethenteron reissneri]